MKSLASVVLACTLAISGFSIMGCHASGSVDTDSTTPQDTKKVTTVNNNTGEKTTKTETHTYPNQNP